MEVRVFEVGLHVDRKRLRDEKPKFISERCECSKEGDIRMHRKNE